tara:strand:- start:3429 stop:3803 length:375 start_codon:yes stop_codon:yes gene_type:complete
VKKDEIHKLYENHRITILNKNRIKISCNKCGGKGKIIGIPCDINQDEDTIKKKDCDVCGGIGILRIKIETIKKGIPIQLFVCEKCNGTGIESQKVLQREHMENSNFLYPLSCNVCDGTGILKRD